MQGYTIHYTEIGSAKPLLVMIGGVNTQPTHWYMYTDMLKAHYTLLIIDVAAAKTDGISSTAIIPAITHKIKSYNSSRVNILAYSIGARLAFNLLNDATIHWGDVVMIAPDGIRTHPLYVLATSMPGRMVFKYVMQHPRVLSTAVGLLHTCKFISTYHYYLVRDLSTRPHLCSNLYNQWMLYSALKPLRTNISAPAYHLYMLFGTRDKTIPATLARRAIKLYPHATVQVVNATHKLNAMKYIDAVKNILHL